MRLTLFQERLPLPVIGYGGTERITQYHFLSQCNLNIHDVTLICADTSTISHPNGKVLKYPLNILNNIRHGRVPTKDYIPDTDILLTNFSEPNGKMNLDGFSGTRVCVCHGHKEPTSAKYQIFLTEGHYKTHLNDKNENTYIVTNGIDEKQLYPMDNEKSDILWFSSVDRRKSSHLVPEISEKLKRKIVAAGSHGSLSGEYIDWRGAINTEQEKVKLFSTAEVYIHTSRATTFEDPCPTTVIESQMCGVPVVAFESGGTRELCYDKRWVFNNIDDYVHCLKNKDYLQTSRKDIREWAVENLSADAMSKRYNKVFEQILLKEQSENLAN